MYHKCLRSIINFEKHKVQHSKEGIPISTSGLKLWLSPCLYTGFWTHFGFFWDPVSHLSPGAGHLWYAGVLPLCLLWKCCRWKNRFTRSRTEAISLRWQSGEWEFCISSVFYALCVNSGVRIMGLLRMNLCMIKVLWYDWFCFAHIIREWRILSNLLSWKISKLGVFLMSLSLLSLSQIFISVNQKKWA